MNFLKYFLKLIANYFGAVLLSKITYDQVLYQRKFLFDLVSNNSVQNLKPGVVCIIFSKDRPMQLYALLDSYLNYVSNPVSIIVIYSANNDSQQKAYLEVIDFFEKSKLKIDFVKEKIFKQTFLNTLLRIKQDKILFLVDDIVFINPVDFNIFKKIDPKKYILSLRHSPFIKKSFTTKSLLSVPSFELSNFSSDLLEFKWFETRGEWSDPWSVDGQLLDTSEVLIISQCSNYKAPNSYEISLKAFDDLMVSRKGLCFKESKILNLPINRVQNEVNNISGNVSVDYLLHKWNLGYCIDTSFLLKHVPSSTHEEHTIKFRKR